MMNSNTIVYKLIATVDDTVVFIGEYPDTVELEGALRHAEHQVEIALRKNAELEEAGNEN